MGNTNLEVVIYIFAAIIIICPGVAFWVNWGIRNYERRLISGKMYKSKIIQITRRRVS
jgi:hypothetical protein